MQSNHGVFHSSNTVTQRNLKDLADLQPFSHHPTVQPSVPTEAAERPALLLPCVSGPRGHISSRRAGRDRNMREGFPIVFASRALSHVSVG